MRIGRGCSVCRLEAQSKTVALSSLQTETAVKMSDPAERQSTAGQRLGAPESFGVSTLEPGVQPPTQPPGRQVSIRVQMLDDTQEVFQISVSHIFCRFESSLLLLCS